MNPYKNFPKLPHKVKIIEIKSFALHAPQFLARLIANRSRIWNGLKVIISARIFRPFDHEKIVAATENVSIEHGLGAVALYALRISVAINHRRIFSIIVGMSEQLRRLIEVKRLVLGRRLAVERKLKTECHRFERCRAMNFGTRSQRETEGLETSDRKRSAS